MRITRRGVIAQRKGDGYVWAVYPIKYVIDESSATTGSFSIRSTYKKMAATAYTTDGTTFTLTSPVSTAVTSLAGKYIVDISTSTNSNTSGSTIYHVDSVSTSGAKRTVSYTAYTAAKAVQGEGELYRVESKTADYPINGVYNGYWYIMLKGEYTVYVWNKYYANMTFSANKTLELSDSDFTSPYIMPQGRYYGWYIDKEVGIARIIESVSPSTLKNKYILLTNSESGGKPELSGTYIWDYNSIIGKWEGCKISDVYSLKYSKYTSSLPSESTAESPSIDAYPQNGAYKGYWYEYSHSYLCRLNNA